MVSSKKLDTLRTVITENLRVQRDGQPIEYINVGTALQDACSRQNHAIFARRGCGKTLLLHFSASKMPADARPIYLNCEEFKRHSFPNVLIEILSSIFRELNRNLHGWFGRQRQSKKIVQDIIERLDILKKSADARSEEVKTRSSIGSEVGTDASLGAKADTLDLKIGAKANISKKDEIEISFKSHRDKLQELDNWLPSLKDSIREFFRISSNVKVVIIQVDDLYHLRRSDQAFVVDYIHRLCKDLPLYFKIATLRHASTLYVDRDGQPVGAQERHDYQPINIDYTFGDFKKTAAQNWPILEKFAEKARLSKEELKFLFKGEGFNRLVMAGGGVPRDVLSLFLEILSDVDADNGGRIGKDEVRIISKSNFERKIEELKQDSKGEEQDDLLGGIYILRQFCLQKKKYISG
ncbi:hypothetical protein [Phreatobacter sp.]|uniref:hypothetical protein n=1 Tax=Phreatobacter sp. TaxID=1966341 RepID=UPI0022C42FF8|nr:hypothetical protein [Phreatobacter sp.]MCZ8313878.1 hypothetical protein [Phreatobacter sp.]